MYSCAGEKVSAQEYKLWYDRPAQVWTEALPLGNGRLGAMVYGTPGTEQIQLNEETIWAGRQRQRKPERTGVYSEGT